MALEGKLYMSILFPESPPEQTRWESQRCYYFCHPLPTPDFPFPGLLCEARVHLIDLPRLSASRPPGKSTFYNAVVDPATDAEGARVAAFPFTTIAPNVGRGTFVVPDPSAALGLDPTASRPTHG